MSNAREEAERRYPYPAPGPFSAVRSDLNAARQAAFLSGAEWQASQCGKCDTNTDASNKSQPVEVTDEMIHRGVKAIDVLLNDHDYESGDMPTSEELARGVLQAALGGAE